jgi:hypothetical protein
MAITKVSSGLISADASSIDLNIDAGTLYLDVSENRVGIGTTSPTNALDINGSQVLLANGALKFADAGNSHIGMIKNSGSSGTGQLEFYTGSAPTERMRIDSSGKVHINETVGRAQLNLALGNVTGAGQFASSQLNLSNPTNVNAISQITFGYDAVGLTNASAYMGYLAVNSSSYGKGSLVFGTRDVVTDTQPTERMRIDSSGQVKIHTPITNDFFGLSLQYNSGDTADFKVNQATGQIKIGGSATGYYPTFWSNNTERMRIDSSGNVGIGATPKAYHSDYKAIDISNSASVMGYTGNNGAWLMENLYYGTDNNWKHKNSDFSALVGMYDGVFNFYNTASGTAGATATLQNRLKIDSSGKVGIGLTNAADYYADQLVVSAPGEGGITIASTATTHNNYLLFADGTSGDTAFRGQIAYAHGSDTMAVVSSGILKFEVGSSRPERMRIDSTGNVLIGDTAQLYASKVLSSFNGATHNGYVAKTTYTSTGSNFAAFLNSGNQAAGRINHNGTTSVSYITTSDYRLKENIQSIENGLSRLNQLNPVQFDWKNTDETSEGFIAHEVQEVFPDAVCGEKDAEEMQGMDYGRITPLLVKAIQEQQTIIDDLKTRIETLENV